MKKHVIRFRKTDENIFEAIKKGIKTIETRAATVRFRNIKDGDILICVCGEEKFEKKIKKVSYFKSVDEMIRAIDFKKVMPFVSSSKELKDVYNSFPGYKEKIKKFGLVVLEL